MPGRFIEPFRAFCPECKQEVIAYPLFTRLGAKEALSTGTDLYVLHTTDRDHRWALNEQERENLRRRLEAGDV